MDIETLNRYIGHKVLLTLENGFRYKIILKKEIIKNDTLSFTGKFGEPIDFKISEISFITIAEDDREVRKWVTLLKMILE